MQVLRRWTKGPRRIKIKSGQDFGSGAMFVVFGMVGVIVSLGYPLGNVRMMGPGYFPLLVSGVLVVVGMLIMIRALLIGKGVVSYPASLRPLVMVLAAVVVFGLLINLVGFLPATFAMVLVSALAGRYIKVVETILLSLVLSIMAIAIFVYGLGLPFRILILP